MGGSNDPTNIVELTIEEHAKAHKDLYEKYHNWQDHLAWRCLNAQIDKEEIQKIKSYRGGLLTPKKKIAKYDADGNLLQIYNSVKEAAEKNNIWTERISEVANKTNKKNSYKGYRYHFFEDTPPEKIEKYINGNSKGVNMYDKNGIFLKSFNSLTEASKEMNVKVQNIGACASGKIKSCGGYIWRYIDA